MTHPRLSYSIEVKDPHSVATVPTAIPGLKTETTELFKNVGYPLTNLFLTVM
jgi:hypothetical protein